MFACHPEGICISLQDSASYLCDYRYISNPTSLKSASCVDIGEGGVYPNPAEPRTTGA